MKNGRIAIPSNYPGGLNNQRAEHFGHCEVFTLVDVENGEVSNVSVVRNQEHGQGGCLVPVNLLAAHKVTALVVGGIGMRPLMGFRQAGIEVYYDGANPEIGSVIRDFLEGKLSLIDDQQVCGGGMHGH